MSLSLELFSLPLVTIKKLEKLQGNMWSRDLSPPNIHFFVVLAILKCLAILYY